MRSTRRSGSGTIQGVRTGRWRRGTQRGGGLLPLGHFVYSLDLGYPPHRVSISELDVASVPRRRDFGLQLALDKYDQDFCVFLRAQDLKTDFGIALAIACARFRCLRIERSARLASPARIADAISRCSLP